MTISMPFNVQMLKISICKARNGKMITIYVTSLNFVKDVKMLLLLRKIQYFEFLSLYKPIFKIYLVLSEIFFD